MGAAPTSAGTGESVLSVTVPLDTNYWTKRLVEVKKLSYATNLSSYKEPCATMFELFQTPSFLLVISIKLFLMLRNSEYRSSLQVFVELYSKCVIGAGSF